MRLLSKSFLVLWLVLVSSGVARASETFLINTHSDLWNDAVRSVHSFNLKEMGRKCPSTFTVPALDIFGRPVVETDTPDDCHCSVPKTKSPAEPIQKTAGVALGFYMTEFFGPIVRQQLKESRCLQDYLKGLDRRQSPEAALIQNKILEDIFPKLKTIVKLEDDVVADLKNLRTAESDKRAAQQDLRLFQRLDPKYDRDIDHWKFLASKTVMELQGLKDSVWAGRSPVMERFLSYYTERLRHGRLTEEQFFVEGMNPEIPSHSLQAAIQQMQKENDERKKIVENAKAPYDFNLIRTLVEAGAHVKHAATLPRSGEYEDFLCYLDAKYGKGRDATFELAKTGVIAVGAVVVPEVVIRYGLVSGETGAALAAFGLADDELRIKEKGICGGGVGFNSVVDPQVCRQVEELKNSNKLYSLQDNLRLLEIQFDKEQSCLASQGVALASAAVAAHPFFVKSGGRVVEALRTGGGAKTSAGELLPNLVRDGLEELKSFGGGLAGLPADQRNLELYQDSKAVLLLADGELKNQLGPAIARKFPKTEVVSTDLSYGAAKVNKNLSYIRVDNSKTFPFPDNHFDKIILQKGLCTCLGNHKTCGGLVIEPQCLATFLNEVTRVLDKKNPKSLIILHGFISDDNDVQVFKQALTGALSRAGLRAQMVQDSTGAIHAVHIFP